MTTNEFCINIFPGRSVLNERRQIVRRDETHTPNINGQQEEWRQATKCNLRRCLKIDQGDIRLRTY